MKLCVGQYSLGHFIFNSYVMELRLDQYSTFEATVNRQLLPYPVSAAAKARLFVLSGGWVRCVWQKQHKLTNFSIRLLAFVFCKRIVSLIVLVDCGPKLTNDVIFEGKKKTGIFPFNRSCSTCIYRRINNRGTIQVRGFPIKHTLSVY